METNLNNPNGSEVFHIKYQDEIRKLIDSTIPTLIQMKKTHDGEGAYLFARSAIDTALEKGELFKKASCNMSCSFCCHDKIYVSQDEGDYIKKVIKEKNITPNADRIAKQKRNNPNIKFADKACPLLSPENEQGQRLCSIYEDRPLICRTHNSTESPEFCDKEKYPGRFVGELKVIAIEAIMMSAIIVGQHENNESEIPMIALHEIL
jgi:Fe-S-cluster containining protein